GEVGHHLRPLLLEHLPQARVAQVDHVQPRARVHPAGIAGGEVVDDRHVVAGRDEAIHHVRADEARSAGHDDLHGWTTRRRHQSMVRRSPSSTSILGSHPSRRRALVMSGWRTFGSSVGRGRNTISLREPLIWTICLASWSKVISLGLPMFTGSLTGACMSAQMPSTRSET